MRKWSIARKFVEFEEAQGESVPEHPMLSVTAHFCEPPGSPWPLPKKRSQQQFKWTNVLIEILQVTKPLKKNAIKFLPLVNSSLTFRAGLRRLNSSNQDLVHASKRLNNAGDICSLSSWTETQARPTLSNMLNSISASPNHISPWHCLKKGS